MEIEGETAPSDICSIVDFFLSGSLQSRGAQDQWEEGTNTLNTQMEIHMKSKSDPAKLIHHLVTSEDSTVCQGDRFQ